VAVVPYDYANASPTCQHFTKRLTTAYNLNEVDMAQIPVR